MKILGFEIKKIFQERTKPELAEVSPNRDDWMQPWLGAGDEIIYVDPILTLSGTDEFKAYFDIYREMLVKWPHLRHCMKKRSGAVLARPLNIEAVSDAAGDVAVAEFCQSLFDGMQGTRKDLRELMDAIYFGFSVSEIMWEARDSQFIVKELRNRNQDRFRFDLDGNLLLDKTGSRAAFEQVPEHKFVVHRYNSEHENPYGWGEARYCYWYYFFQKNSLKFWSLFTEKFASPTVVGKHPPGISQGEKDALLTALKAIQNDQAVRIPDTMVVEFLEAQRAGSLDSYDRFIRYLELSVSKVILGGTLTSDEGKFGTRAQAEVHETARSEYADEDAEELCETLKDQILSPAVRYNFGEAETPGVSMEEEKSEDLYQRAQTDEILVRIGVPLSHKYFYEQYGRPEPEEAGGEGITKGEQKESAFAEASADKVDEAWRKNEDKYTEEAIKRGKDFYNRFMAGIMGAVKETKDERGIYNFGMLPGQAENAALGSFLTSAIFTARLNGVLEIKQLADKEGVKFASAFAEASADKYKYVFEPLAPEDAIEYFKDLVPMTKDEMEGMLWEARFAAFTVSDIQSRDVVAKVQDSLTKALSEGQTFAKWKDQTGQMFDALGVTPLNDFRMRTIFQTNIHNALVEGRDRMMANLVQQGIVKMGRWQTAGDSRVRLKHALHEGKTYPYNDSVWQELRDYGCRCNKIPDFS